MSRIIIAYTAAGLCLFGALFASFAIIGFGRPAARDVSAPVAVSVQPTAPAPSVYTPPTLEPGRAYSISHDTPIYREPSLASSDPQTLPNGGLFTAVHSFESSDGPWTEILVSDRSRDATMYLFGMDLRWKTLVPVYSADEVRDAQREAVIAQLREKHRLRREQRAALAPPPEPEPQTVSEWWAETAERLGGATPASLMVSGTAAAITTLLTIGSIAVITMLRRQSAWTRPQIYDDVIDLEPDEDHVTYAPPRDGRVSQGNGDSRRA